MSSILIGLNACAKEPPVIRSEFCSVVTPDLMGQLSIHPEDREDEVNGKLRIWGRYLCLCEGDCPKGP